MSSPRNRSQSQVSPKFSQRILQNDLEGVGSVVRAFDGFKSAGPVPEVIVLQRPIGPHQRSLLQQLLKQASNLFGLSILALMPLIDGNFDLLAGFLPLCVSECFNATKC